MFIGHYAPAFAAAASCRAPRLGALFVAAQLVDLAFFVFVLSGVEHMRETPGFTVMNSGDFYDMRFTHSLIGALGFAAAFAIVARLRRVTWAAAWIGAAVVASHWLLDLLVHAPDLTIAGVGRRYGFALWNRPTIEMPLELSLTFGALTFYAARTSARNWFGHLSLSLLAIALVAVQLVNWLSPQPTIVLDPIPPSIPLTALFAYAVLAALAWWVAATREHAHGAGPSVALL